MKYKRLYDAAKLFDDAVKSRKTLPSSKWVMGFFLTLLRREIHYLGHGGFKRAFVVKANKNYFVLKIAAPDIIHREWNAMQMARLSNGSIRARTARYYWKTQYCLLQRYLPTRATKDRCAPIRSIAKKYGFWDITPRNVGATKTGMPKIFDLEPPRIKISLKSSQMSDWDFLKKVGPKKIELLHSHYNSILREHVVREWFVKNLSYAVPSQEAITRIKSFAKGSPILEIGAGLGLWALLLQKAGVKVTPTDISPEVSDARYNYCNKRQGLYTPIVDMAHMDAVQAYGNTHPVLMFGWPPYSRSMAHEALTAFKGDRLIYIGECGGCTADETFETLLEKHWDTIESFRIPQWWGLHDCMRLFVRKPITGAPS